MSATSQTNRPASDQERWRTPFPSPLANETFLQWLLIGLLIVGWGLAWRNILSVRGLFRWIGIDYGLFRAQSNAFLVGGGSALYDLGALRRQLEPLAAYTTAPGLPLAPGPVPFAPVFAWLFTAFSLTPPPVGFALWTSLNFVAAIHLARRAAQFFPAKERLWVGAIVLTSFPVAYTLWVGQPMILLACTVAEAYLSLRAGKSFRAGMWLSCLLIKPQYGLLVGPMLIWKRQWPAVAGAVAGLALILGASLAVAGPNALLTYPSSLGELSKFNGAGTLAYPQQHVNWRGMILRLIPSIDDRTGILLTLVLGGLTVLLTALAWRGPWSNRDPKFAAQMVILMIATLLANYHSHVHGTVLLIVPLAALFAETCSGNAAANATKVLAFLPTAIFLATYSVELTAWMLSLGMLVLFVRLCWVNWPWHRQPESLTRHVKAIFVRATHHTSS